MILIKEIEEKEEIIEENIILKDMVKILKSKFETLKIDNSKFFDLIDNERNLRKLLYKEFNNKLEKLENKIGKYDYYKDKLFSMVN